MDVPNPVLVTIHRPIEQPRGVNLEVMIELFTVMVTTQFTFINTSQPNQLTIFSLTTNHSQPNKMLTSGV
jgi:hypothetical protein